MMSEDDKKGTRTTAITNSSVGTTLTLQHQNLEDGEEMMSEGNKKGNENHSHHYLICGNNINLSATELNAWQNMQGLESK